MKGMLDIPREKRTELFQKIRHLITNPLSQQIFTASFNNNRELLEELLKRPGAVINAAILGAAIGKTT